MTYNGKRASVILTVKPEPTSVSAPASMTLGAGQTALLAATVNAESAGQIFYTSNDENVVSVDALSGKLIARGAGTATILCEAYNGVQATTEVTVLAAPTRVSLGASSIKI